MKTRYLSNEEYMNEEVLQINDRTDFNIENTNDNSKVRISISIEPVLCTNCEQINSQAYIDYKVIISDKQESIMKTGICGIDGH